MHLARLCDLVLLIWRLLVRDGGRPTPSISALSVSFSLCLACRRAGLAVARCTSDNRLRQVLWHIAYRIPSMILEINSLAQDPLLKMGLPTFLYVDCKGMNVSVLATRQGQYQGSPTRHTIFGSCRKPEHYSR